MRIILVHDRYLHRGGEDSVLSADGSLLEQFGHDVIRYTEDNHRIARMFPLAVFAQSIWSPPTYARFGDALRANRPQIAYFFNTFPLISPSAYDACRAASIPVIQGLHNFRLMCPSAIFFREGKLCEDCLGKTPPWPGVWHKCYHDSRSHSAAVAIMMTAHRWLRIWQNKVDLFVAPSEFARKKFIAGGLPAEKIFVKPNFVLRDPGIRSGLGKYALFMGRLSKEKGLATLIDAWRRLDAIPLKIVGGGVLDITVQNQIHSYGLKNVELLGELPPAQAQSLLQEARFLVFPSECYETFGMSIIEAYAYGVPVLASRLGAMEELVAEGRTGLFFHAGDSAELATKAEWAWTHPDQLAEMGKEARQEYERKYTAEANYKLLMQLYGRVSKSTR
jgi:glycosyltransferase involved in cell wall biosynthesis